MKILIFTLGLLINTQNSLAQELKPVKPKPANPINHPGFRPITCQNIQEQLAQLKYFTNENNQGVAAYTGDVAGIMEGWARQLTTLEGKTVDIPKDRFKVMREGAKQVEEVQAMVWENSSILDQRFGDILEVLKTCVK